MSQRRFHPSKVAPLVSRLENCLREPKTPLRQRRIKNFYAEAKYHEIPLHALRVLLEGRRRLRLVHTYVGRLPPHRRAEVAALAQAIGDTSELFQFTTIDASSDIHLQALR